ncbi:uncharacterized protein LOC129741383 [Uranotaenia lowii]|uniref:uncharacterized protein LOC129741383 n=1 Tax=Uranotaenia lowii TaxID=190385 RepID=UPI00247996DD|nr:uncharacterized protein LOC129741383 [Uranotaenia lowii]
MGICLDTDKSNTTQEVEESDWKGGGGRGDASRLAIVRSPTLGAGGSPINGGGGAGGMHNTGKVKFDPPKVPVIFVLGGPGSGKVTHCDTLMQERRGVTHINMMDLLQQYAMGNVLFSIKKVIFKTDANPALWSNTPSTRRSSSSNIHVSCPTCMCRLVRRSEAVSMAHWAAPSRENLARSPRSTC